MSDPAPAGTVRLEVTGPTRTATLDLPAGDHITLAIQPSGSYYERELPRRRERPRDHPARRCTRDGATGRA